MPLNKENQKRIVYVTSVRLPTEKAHGLSTVKICEAFSESGYKVDLIIPRLWRKNGGDIYNYYGVKNNFKIFKLPCVDLIPLRVFDKVTFIIQSLSFSLFMLVFVFFKYWRVKDETIFFSHDYIPLYFASLLPFKIFYDIHHFPGKNFMYKKIMERSFGFAVQTKWKINELGDKFGISPSRIIYWPNGTDVERFNVSISKEEARKELGIPGDKKIIMYTGSLFDWKGVDSLIRSIKHLPEDTLIYLVGATNRDILVCKENIEEANDSRVVFVEFQSYLKIPTWDRAADILVLPNTGKQKVSLYYTSPMKLFDYMASGKPIVATSIPSILEILNKENSLLVEPDSPEDLARGITLVLNDDDLGKKLGNNSLLDSKKYTWLERARKITNFFNEYV
ncbi:MAG TPA: glycosyltransferase family 4 protein [Candidatus Paceibacterota bacterium]